MNAAACAARLRGFYQTIWKFPMRILSAPFKGFDEMKYGGQGSYAFAFFVLVFSSLLNILEFVYTGFLFNYYDPYFINSLYLTSVTLFTVALFVTANWSVTTLLDGKGRYGEIFMTTMYALFPMCLCRLIALGLSNVLALDEEVFITAVQTIGGVLFGFYLFIGLIVVHEYTFSKALGCVLLTACAMMVIAFILMLAFSLAADVVDFFTVLFKELSLKYF